MSEYEVKYIFWLPLESEDFTSENMLSAIDRIRTKLENNIEFKDITEIKHNDNNSKTFSYIQYKFNYNQVTMKLTVDEFGFYFIEFLKNTKNTKILISNLFNTFFVEHNNWELYNNEYTLDDVSTKNWKDEHTILTQKQRNLLFSSLLNPIFDHNSFRNLDKNNSKKVIYSKIETFLNDILVEVSRVGDIFDTDNYKKYKEDFANKNNIFNQRLYDLSFGYNKDCTDMERSYVQRYTETKALLKFLSVASSNKYINQIQNSLDIVTDKLINTIFILSKNGNSINLSNNTTSKWQEEDIERYIELASYSMSAFKSIDRLVNYTYYMQIGNKTSYQNINPNEQIDKNLEYNKWKLSIVNLESKISKSMELLKSYTDRKIYNELENINRHQLAINDNNSINNLLHDNEKVGLTHSAMSKLQVFVSVLASISVSVPVAQYIMDKDWINVFIFILVVLSTTTMLYFVLSFLIQKYLNYKILEDIISFPFIKLEYKSRNILYGINISHNHHDDYNHEVYDLLDAKRLYTVKNIIEDIESTSLEQSVVLRTKKLLIEKRLDINYENEKDSNYQNYKDIIKKLDSNDKNKILNLIESLKINSIYRNKINNVELEEYYIPKEIKEHEYSHSIERIDRYKHKILLRFSCEDDYNIKKRKRMENFTNYIFDDTVKGFVKLDIDNNESIEDKINYKQLLDRLRIKSVISYSFILKTSGEYNHIKSTTGKNMNFIVVKDYIKIYFSIEVKEKDKKSFIKMRNIVNKHISNSFYEKIIHHMHSNDI